MRENKWKMTEPQLTHLIYEILSPEENPELARLYLELFDKHVLRLEMTPAELNSAEVYEEYETEFVKLKDSRYIDLVIITNRRFIPIEVKIDAGERPNQCYDYWHEAEKYHETYSLIEPPVLYFLTPSGYFPESANGLYLEAIDPISFRSEIFRWLKDCLKHTPKNSPCIRKILLLYLKTCLIIGKTTVLEKIMRKFFTALDEQFNENFCKKYHLKRGSSKREEVGDFQDWRRGIERFYGNYFFGPGIGLLCTDAMGNVKKFDNDKELWFRVECNNATKEKNIIAGISGEMCAGFMIFDHSIKNCPYETAEVKKILRSKRILPKEFAENYRESFGGIIGRIILHDAQGNIIDFRDIDDFWLGLMNPAGRADAVEHIMKEIKALLRRFVYG